MSREMQRSTTQGMNSREALLRAATELFGEKGPAAVSTRQIAAEANVNSGLIHRHFRTKDALLREVLNGLAREISEVKPREGGSRLDVLLSFFRATSERTNYWKLLARCILDGEPTEVYQSEFPTMRRVVELFEQAKADGDLPADVDAKGAAAVIVAMALGYLVFEPWLVPAAGLDDRELSEARAAAYRAAMSLMPVR